MKYIPRVRYGGVVLALVLGFLLAADPAQAFPSPFNLLHSLSHDFLRHNSQGYLGVDVEDVAGQGPEIVAIDHDAPAGKAGLKVHDVLLQMNGQAIGNCDQLRHMLRRQPPGRTVTFVISRHGSAIHLTARLADRTLLEQQAWSHHYSVPEPAAVPQGSGAQSFVASGSSSASYLPGGGGSDLLFIGVEVSPVGHQLADYFGVTDGTGLLVENVDSRSPASQAGLQAGDVILKVNSVPMVSRNDWQKAIRSNQGKMVNVTIMRNKQEQTLTMPAGSSKGG